MQMPSSFTTPLSELGMNLSPQRSILPRFSALEVFPRLTLTSNALVGRLVLIIIMIWALSAFGMLGSAVVSASMTL